MHVCLVHRDLHHITRGGIGTVYQALAERLLAHGHQVTLVTQHTPHPVRLDGARVITLPRTGDLTVHRREVALALDQLRPDVVDCSTWAAETLIYLRQPRRRRAPVVVRGDLSAATMNAVRYVSAEHELVHLADQVVAVSRFAARDLAAAYVIPLPVVVPNGVDRGRFHPGPVAPPCSGFRVYLGDDGTVTSKVKLTELLDARQKPAPWWADADGRLRLAWVGKITEMKGWDRLERLLPRLGRLAHVTILLGHAPAYCPVNRDALMEGVTVLQDLATDDLPGFYRAADYLLSTSRWEGFGLAIAEALACGTPVLLPAELGTAPELLAASGGLVYRDDEHLFQLLAAPGPVIGRLPAYFDWDANAEASLGIYESLLDSGAR
ncbi:MAG: glycosyltransferase [Streptosporangiales bacterium]|nr:glycosyltransferase [Streptosporangiales bacterium]